MEERRVKRFQIGDSISPTSFVPVKRKSNKDPYSQVRMPVSTANCRLVCSHD